MRKIIAIVSDDAKIDLSSLVAYAKEFRIEALPNEEVLKRKVHRSPNGDSVESTIMKHFTPQGHFLNIDAGKWLSEVGYAETSSSGALSTLAKEGYVERLNRGRFRFLKPYVQ